MTATGLESFDATVQKTNAWLRELMEQRQWDRHQAYHALRVVLHALRDRMGVDETAAFAAQLPMLVRGLYFEGWNPDHNPHREKRGAFLAGIACEYRDRNEDVDSVARAVFRVLTNHLTEGEIAKVKHRLPEEIRALWPN